MNFCVSLYCNLPSTTLAKLQKVQNRWKPQRSTTLASLQSDKYAAFSKLDKVKGSKGWSGKITSQMNGNPMGWSDEMLGVSTDEDELHDFELERSTMSRLC